MLLRSGIVVAISGGLWIAAIRAISWQSRQPWIAWLTRPVGWLTIAAGLVVLAVVQTLNCTIHTSRPLEDSERTRLAWRISLGWLGRDVFWAGLLYIVGHAVYTASNAGQILLELVFFPATYVIYPWASGLWPVLIISFVGYWISTWTGGLDPVD
jgi:hypothetical protein